MATRLYIGDSSKTPAIVKVEEVAKTKYGANVDMWIGEVDENGVLQAPTAQIELNFAGITEIGSHALYYAFCGRSKINSVDLSSVTTIDEGGLADAFQYCTSLTYADLRSLQSVGKHGMLETFKGCINLINVDFSSLQSIGNLGLQSAFMGCFNITKMFFPALTNVQTDSFGKAVLNNMFYNCTRLTEIHFRADMQSTIEAMSQYTNKWGATNATVYFDL